VDNDNANDDMIEAVPEADIDDEGGTNPTADSENNDGTASEPESEQPVRNVHAKRCMRNISSGLGKFWQTAETGKRQRKPKVVLLSTKESSVDEFSSAFLDAKRKELQSFEDEQVFTRCHKDRLPAGTQVISTRWVCRWKPATDGDEQQVAKSAKARLVARGFQENVNDEFVDSPTGTRDSLRTVAFLAAQNNPQGSK